MSRFIPLVTGLALASAITIKFRDTVIKDHKNIHQQLNSAKSTLDNAVDTTSKKVSTSERYLSDRLVPSGT